MRIHLRISKDNYHEVKGFLEEKGIEITPEAEYILSEKDNNQTHITVRRENGDRVVIPLDQIMYLESFGHQLEVTTQNGTFFSSDPLYQMEQLLDPKKYIRINKSVIVAKGEIMEIFPTLSMKYLLKMKDGCHHEVTRSYYNQFKEAFKI